MIQHADVPNPTIEAIASELGERLRPWRIVLFGSRARGDARTGSDYDLFIEVDVPTDSLPLVQDRIGELLSQHHRDVDLHVGTAGQIERRHDDPGTLEWDVAREGIVLYANPGAPPLPRASDRVRENTPHTPESVAEWIAIGDQDRRHAQHLLDTDGDFWSAICFLAQQTSEKHLKALLVARHVRPVRTHDLVALLADLRRAGCALPAVDDDCKLLKKYAVLARYSRRLRLDEATARAAFAASERIVSAVLAELPIELRSAQ